MDINRDLLFGNPWDEEYFYSIFQKIVDFEMKFEIKKVIFNDPATIVYWADGTKTVVKRWAEDESEFDKEKGLAMAFVKRALDNRDNYKIDFRKWTE